MGAVLFARRPPPCWTEFVAALSHPDSPALSPPGAPRSLMVARRSLAFALACATLALFALRPDAVYQLRDWDRYEHAFNMSGAELMAVGVTLGNASSVLEAAFVVEYERVA